MKQKDVLITLKTKQSIGGPFEETEMITDGRYQKTSDGCVIRYDETEATGYNGCTTTLTVTGDDLVVLDRTGPAASQLVIDMQKKHYCNYFTPYGSLQMGIHAKDIKSKLNENGGELFFKYAIDVGAAAIGNYEVNINIKEC